MTADPCPLPYKRVLLKIGGEALAGDAGYGIDEAVMSRMANEVREVHDLGCEIALVIGGGNIFRGLAASTRGMARATADYMGMLATLINSLAMQEALETVEVQTRVLSALSVSQVAEPYIRRRATRHLEKGRVVLFAAGTGNPYVTTDTASALRALEINAEVLLMAKNNVDGVYDSDPNENPDARRFGNLDYMDALNPDISGKRGIMDATAVSLCMDNELPIIVFDIFRPGSMGRILCGESVGTTITSPLPLGED